MTLALDIGDRGADISPCGRYRYSLWRRWDAALPSVLFCMLNPSTADADVDDQTIAKVVGFAKRWGYGEALVWNLYAYRATNPSELDTAKDPIGRLNDGHLWPLMERADRIVAAWGALPNRGKYANREKVMFWGPFHDREVYALGLTKGGYPRHPSRAPYNVAPIRYLGPPS
jgi:hypothetical protein